MNAPPEEANARPQLERVNRLTDKPRLWTRIRRVNAGYAEAELRRQEARGELREFANALTESPQASVPGGAVGSTDGVRAWLRFYDGKQAAYAKLVVALPQVAAIPDFWRYVQNMRVAQWLPIIEAEVERITVNSLLCRDCGAVEVAWPSHWCAQCQKARRRATYRNAKQRKRIQRQMRKCAACRVEPLGSRQRLCSNCKANDRRERNRRYQKSLKDQKLRRVQPDFTREKNSTVSASAIPRCPARNVDREAVLRHGCRMAAGHDELHTANRAEHSRAEVTR